MISWLLACVSAGDSGAGADLHQDTGVMPDAPIPAATLEPDALEPLIEQFIAEELVLPTELYTWFMGVYADLEAGAGTCPTWQVSPDRPTQAGVIWNGTCTGQTYTAAGDYSLLYVEEEDETRHALQAVQLWSLDGEVITGGGGRLLASGQSELLWTQTERGAIIRASALGSFEDAAGPTPLQGAIAPAVGLDGEWPWTGGFEGTLGGAVGMDARALGFDDVRFSAACGADSGGLDIRDPSGGWWRVDFVHDCSGCGSLSYGGAAMGEVCVGATLTEALDARLRAFAEAVQ